MESKNDMLLPEERIHYLLEAYTSGRITDAEEQELMEWILEAENAGGLKKYVRELWHKQDTAKDFSYVNWDAIYARAVKGNVFPIHSPEKKTHHILRLTAAAAILILMLTGAYFYFFSNREPSVAALSSSSKDIAPPAGNKAVLTLADGRRIEVGDMSEGTIALEGDIKITRQANGDISYTGHTVRETAYNRFDVPLGSKPLGLALVDGSRVWLNVGSSITYPAAFTGRERKVTITGEAYFEVAHAAGKPFIVQYKDVAVKVLGTHFNVNTYTDEATDRVTLLEGSVRINKNGISKLLQPGQQASISRNTGNNITVSNDIDMEEVMAWKNDKFRFSANMDIKEIMRQISRWYNVEIEYKGTVTQRFWGSISKEVNVSQVLQILEATGGVKFNVEGQKIVVIPAAP